MKAILLSAGQGRRLLPWTAEQPKCLLPVAGEESLLAHQLRALARAGVTHATVAAGFGVEQVERALHALRVPGLSVEMLFNPFFALADNLVTCWLARGAMDQDFVLLNGDTLFEDRVLARLLDGVPGPIALAVDPKRRFDDDDMRVARDARGRLAAIGKHLAAERADAESIGLALFRGEGPKRFAQALDRAVRRPEALSSWYVAALADLAAELAIETLSVEGLWWREIDSPEDLRRARSELSARL